MWNYEHVSAKHTVFPHFMATVQKNKKAILCVVDAQKHNPWSMKGTETQSKF